MRVGPELDSGSLFVRNATPMALSLSESTIWFALILCGAVALGSVVVVLFLTGKSKFSIRREARVELEALSEIVQACQQRFAKIDQTVIDKLHTLSPNASQAYSVARALVSLMQQRALSVQRLVTTGDLDSLFRAQRILRSPLESSADQLNSIIFSDTVVNLNPDQFSSALNSILTVVERDLSGEGSSPRLTMFSEPAGGLHRRRKFTIRGFLQSVTGEGPKDGE